MAFNFLVTPGKILRFNDEACSSLMFSNLQGVLTIGASDESADTILPFLLNRVSSVYPKLALDVRVKRNAYMAEMLESGSGFDGNHPSSFYL